MERDNWPEFKLFNPLEALKKVGHAVGHFVLGADHPFATHGDHFLHMSDETPNTGAAPSLDRYLNEPTDDEAVLPHVSDLGRMTIPDIQGKDL